jgi:hypothetical protein
LPVPQSTQDSIRAGDLILANDTANPVSLSKRALPTRRSPIKQESASGASGYRSYSGTGNATTGV